MRIGIDIRPLMDKHYSGVSEYTYNLLMALFDKDKVNQYKLFYNSFRDVSERIPNFNRGNVEVIRLKYPNKILNYFFFKFLKRPKIDEKIGGVDLMFMPHINFISLSRKCKKVITVHDLSFLLYPHYFSIRSNFWHKNIKVKKLLADFDHIISVSDHTKKDVQNICHVPAKKISTVYSGINKKYRVIDKNDPYLAEAGKKYRLPGNFILFLGTLEPRKNIEGIIEAYENFRRENYSDLIHFEGQAEVDKNKIKLVIAGRRGWGYRGIYEQARRSAFAGDIIFTDYISEEDKVYIYNLAEIFIYPSFYEGFGFPPLEAVACGTPCVVSNVSSLPEIMGTAAILVDPYNISEMGQAISQLANNETLRKQLREIGLRKVKNYDWEKCAAEILDVFAEMV
ncbi:hypothetical protein COT99_01620 [Candidatus Falkowbacteria bacterium CG10_big_fil_rev_8_21_14_0_10_43_10]|uniref:Glycosyltransferase family 1 protein n=1 Tax=Candidatus Falkowbacteria bacterium CG10_big_fil_rev_8_21_14_0_10_43_10 TaxID=1974567 RepID=A0A2H0V2F5_9BACT|nr:MAG: hypothetical protein COT99_01620 [Candidatus Falkowbacteria bacterium CG10_big_fil_rev_8_21_14_0_10_43_10]